MQSLEHGAIDQTARPQFQERQHSMAPFHTSHGQIGQLRLVTDGLPAVILWILTRGPVLSFEHPSGRHDNHSETTTTAVLGEYWRSIPRAEKAPAWQAKKLAGRTIKFARSTFGRSIATSIEWRLTIKLLDTAEVKKCQSCDSADDPRPFRCGDLLGKSSRVREPVGCITGFSYTWLHPCRD
jgi:hypothetical protein